MNNERIFKLERIKAGKPVFFTMCSQCCSKAKIEFMNNNQPVETIEKTDTNSGVKCWGCKTFTSPCDSPSIRIFIDNKATMKVQRNPQIIIGHNGEEKGVNYTFHIEDMANGDSDYNDYYINIVSWDKRR